MTLKANCRLCGYPFNEPDWESLRAEMTHHFTHGEHLPPTTLSLFRQEADRVARQALSTSVGDST